MDVRTYRARSMQEALQLIRDDLGPDAAVLHTREVSAGLLGGLFGGRTLEVTASNEVQVPSRLAELRAEAEQEQAARSKKNVRQRVAAKEDMPPANNNVATLPTTESLEAEHGKRFRQQVQERLKRVSNAPSVVDELATKSTSSGNDSAALFQLFTDLMDAGFSESLARELLDHVKRKLDPRDWRDPLLVKAHLVRHLEEEIAVRGPIRLTPGRCTKVALVGPTGVGKTTTIAKLAANFRLKNKAQVGLITVDTYRIAAVEQLRTYADIIDLPMEVVATPKEMRAAVERFANFDLVLIDTAGRSPRDEAQIQELRAMLAEAKADEVHLVLSSVTATDSLRRSTERFSAIGASHLVLTKIDEAAGLGSLLPVLRKCQLPLTYLTDGQTVPHDIRSAERRSLARLLLGLVD